MATLPSEPRRSETASAHDKSTTTKRTGESFPILPWSATAAACNIGHRRWLFENCQMTLRPTACRSLQAGIDSYQAEELAGLILQEHGVSEASENVRNDQLAHCSWL